MAMLFIHKIFCLLIFWPTSNSQQGLSKLKQKTPYYLRAIAQTAMANQAWVLGVLPSKPMAGLSKMLKPADFGLFGIIFRIYGQKWPYMKILRKFINGAHRTAYQTLALKPAGLSKNQHTKKR